MDYKVVFKPGFLEDLESVVRQIARHNPVAAQKLGELIILTAESLNYFPERYPEVRERPGIRRFIAGKRFKVFYRVHHESRSVEILRCWDGRRGSDPTLS